MARPQPRLNVKVVAKLQGCLTWVAVKQAYYDGSKSVPSVANTIASFATFDGALIRIQSMAKGGVSEYKVKDGVAVKVPESV